MENRIHGVAVDAGSGLAKVIKTARGANARDDDLMTFKRAVLTELGGGASTVLLDADLGPDLLADYPAGCAPMLAYEADVYQISDDDRITVLPEHLSVADVKDLGVDQLKFFMYFAPDGDAELNTRKLDLVAKIGAECADHDLTFLVEPLVYHAQLVPGTLDYALAKPEMVRRATKAFADPRIGAGVLKVEVPVDLDFVEGFGEAVMSRDDAITAFRTAAAAANRLPLVYLSAGVTFDRFAASLRLAVAAGVDFSGFMCGRAIWSDVVPIFGADGEVALRQWLRETGRARLDRLIAIIEAR